MTLNKVFSRLREMIEPFRYPEQRTKKNYIVVFGVYALAFSVDLFIFVYIKH